MKSLHRKIFTKNCDSQKINWKFLSLLFFILSNVTNLKEPELAIFSLFSIKLY
jgi:hypothetical protein